MGPQLDRFQGWIIKQNDPHEQRVCVPIHSNLSIGFDSCICVGGTEAPSTDCTARIDGYQYRGGKVGLQQHLTCFRKCHPKTCCKADKPPRSGSIAEQRDLIQGVVPGRWSHWMDATSRMKAAHSFGAVSGIM